MQAEEASEAFVAALHCALHAPQLTHYALSDCFAQDLQRKRQNACALAEEYASLARAFWREGPAAASADPAWRAFKKVNKAAAVRSDDVGEVLEALLRNLHDALAKTQRIEGSLAEEHVSLPAWLERAEREGYSFLTEVFQAQLETAVWGLEGSGPATHEHPWALRVCVDGCTTLHQALARALEPQTVDGYAGHATATASKRYTWLPLVLVVSLRRSSEKFVEYVADLDASGYVRSVDECRYSLCAVGLRRPPAAAAGPARHVVLACAAPGDWNVLGPGRCEPLPHVNDIIQKDAALLVYRLLV